MRQFEQVWKEKEAEGYRYGKDALEGVRFGYELALAELDRANNSVYLMKADSTFILLSNDITKAVKTIREVWNTTHLSSSVYYGMMNGRYTGCAHHLSGESIDSFCRRVTFLYHYAQKE